MSTLGVSGLPGADGEGDRQTLTEGWRVVLAAPVGAGSNPPSGGPRGHLVDGQRSADCGNPVVDSEAGAGWRREKPPG